jgi:hypothetical protein
MTRPRESFNELNIDPPPVARGRLVLIRDEHPRAPIWPESFADDICDELCSAVDEGVTVEDALRAVLQTLCGRMRWNAGRAAHRDVQPLWFVDSYKTVRMLRREVRLRDAGDCEIPWSDLWSVSRSGEMLRFLFPIDWSAQAWLELYSADSSKPYANALDDVARALVPAAMILAHKHASRAR